MTWKPTLLLLPLLAGCAYSNQFREARTDSPHATLTGDGVKLIHLNGQPTSFWRSREVFRVPTGLTSVQVISGYRGEVHYRLLRFQAEPGHHYSIHRQQDPGSDAIVLQEDQEGRIMAREKPEPGP